MVCVDQIPEKVASILRGQSPIYEPGLDEMMKRNLKAGRFTATMDLGQAVRDTQITLIAVPTPCKNGRIDLRYVKAAARQVGHVLKDKMPYHVVAVKSTVIPSTSDSVVRPILEQASGKPLGEFGLCTNPEFLREGDAIKDFLLPDRVVIGADDDRSFEVFKKVYSPFRCPVIHTNLRTAELIKYTSNSLLAALISYSNEIACIAEAIGDIDILEVMRGLHLDARLTPFVKGTGKSSGGRLTPGILAYLKAGCGYGGSCLPKDVPALCAIAEKRGYKPHLLRDVIGINLRQPVKLMERLQQALGRLKNKKVTVWGIAFKPDTDDVRDTPAKPIVDFLLQAGAKVSVSSIPSALITPGRPCSATSPGLPDSQLKVCGRSPRPGGGNFLAAIQRCGFPQVGGFNEEAGFHCGRKADVRKKGRPAGRPEVYRGGYRESGVAG